MTTQRLMLAASLATVALLGLWGCSRDAALLPSSRSESGDGTTNRPAAPQFTDIPVPEGASMDLRGTLVLGGADIWVGRLAMSTRRGPSEIFDFYHTEMPKFGWQEVTAVRSAISVLTYRRGARIATVQVQGAALGTSEVDFTVAPEATQTCADPNDCGGNSMHPPPRPRSTAVERIR